MMKPQAARVSRSLPAFIILMLSHLLDGRSRCSAFVRSSSLIHGTRIRNRRGGLIGHHHHHQSLSRGLESKLKPSSRAYSVSSLARDRNANVFAGKRRRHDQRSTRGLLAATKVLSADPPFTTTMDESSLYTKLQWLSQEIRRHDEFYYNEQSEITDDDYDALVRAEAKLCREHPALLAKWQTESGLGVAATRYGGRVGVTSPSTNSSFITGTGTMQSAPATITSTATASDRVKRQHERPMLSLDNVNNNEELLAWLERVRKKLVAKDQQKSEITVVSEPKLDGLSLSLHYAWQDANSYRLEWAATRGDGKQGQDVTAAVLDGMQLPDTLSWEPGHDNSDLPKTVEIRGEVVMPQTVFESIVAKAGDNVTFSNARNAASGILLRKEQVVESDSVAATNGEFSSLELRSKLRFYAYDTVTLGGGATLNGIEARNRLGSLGFLVPEPIAATTLVVNNETAWEASDIKTMLDYHESLRLHREGSAQQSVLKWGDYDMDGCVHKISEEPMRLTLGASNRAPRWAIAHKSPPLSAVTTLLDIGVQVGRTGALTPVAILEPVDLRGVTVQRATLHNFVHMRQLLGSVDRLPKGTQVMVRRAGDVIPQVVQRVGQLDDFNGDAESFISLDAPTKCPSCGSPAVADIENKTTTEEENVTVGQVLRCGGPQLLCPARAVGALAHAYSRDALDITGLSEARIQQLMDAKLLTMPSDLFTLSKNKERLEMIAEMDGWGPKSADNLARVATRVATSGVSLSQFIYSLSIRYSGVHSSALVAAAYGSVGSFLDAVDHAAMLNSDSKDESFALLREETDANKGIGPVLLSSLKVFSNEKEMVAGARELARNVHVMEDHSRARLLGLVGSAETPSSQQPLAGMSVVFTGAIANLSRSEAKKLAKEMGAKSTPGSISQSTGMVVAGVKGGKKLEQAETLGVRVVNSDEFNAMVERYREAIATALDSAKD